MPARLFSALIASFLLASGLASAQTLVDPALFPAAAGIKSSAQPVGPVRIGPATNAAGIILQPNDLIGLDTAFTGASAPNNTGGAILNFSVRNNGAGAETVLASSSVGSGVTYGLSQTGSYIAVSPAGIIYYTNNAKNIVALNPNTLVRTVVPTARTPASAPCRSTSRA